MSQQTDNSVASFYAEVKKLGALYIENAKLSVAEKATVLLSAVAIFMMSMLLALAGMVFLVIGIASLLESVIAPFWSYLIVAGVFALAIAVLYVFREKLVFNPVARFVSRLMLKAQEGGKSND